MTFLPIHPFDLFILSFCLLSLQLLLIEIYKTIDNLNPSFMAKVFAANVAQYNLRGSTNLILPKARTNLSSIDTVKFVGQKL